MANSFNGGTTEPTVVFFLSTDQAYRCWNYFGAHGQHVLGVRVVMTDRELMLLAGISYMEADMEIKQAERYDQLKVTCSSCGKTVRNASSEFEETAENGDELCRCSSRETSIASPSTDSVAGAKSTEVNASAHGAATTDTAISSPSSAYALSDAEIAAVQANLGDRYKVVSLLGRGGMGAVFKVKDTELNRTFAIKVLNSQLVTDATSIKRFEQEARAAKDLTQANLVAVYDYGIGKSGAPFIIMDYLEGENLADILAKEGYLDTARAVDIFIQVVEAVVHAHMKGVIHRDIKPSNIIIEKGPGGTDLVKLVDFGIAKVLPTETQRTQMTQTGEIFGSPLYMSPEQCLGNKLDARSDIYEIGCVMYEALTGIQPFAAENAIKSIMKHIHEDVTPILELKQDFGTPKSLDRVIQHCLEREPDNRYQTSQDLLKDLQAVRDKRDVSIKPKRNKKPSERSKRIWRAATIFSVVGSLLLILFYVSRFTAFGALGPLDPDNDSERLDLLSYQYFLAGQYSKAIPLLEFGIAHYKESGKHESWLADQLQHVGECYLRMNQPAKAVQYYQDALGHYRKWGNYSGGYMPKAVANYGEVLRKLGRADAAAKMQDEFQKTGNLQTIP